MMAVYCNEDDGNSFVSGELPLPPVGKGGSDLRCLTASIEEWPWRLTAPPVVRRYQS